MGFNMWLTFCIGCGYFRIGLSYETCLQLCSQCTQGFFSCHAEEMGTAYMKRPITLVTTSSSEAHQDAKSLASLCMSWLNWLTGSLTFCAGALAIDSSHHGIQQALGLRTVGQGAFQASRRGFSHSLPTRCELGLLLAHLRKFLFGCACSRDALQEHLPALILSPQQCS